MPDTLPGNEANTEPQESQGASPPPLAPAAAQADTSLAGTGQAGGGEASHDQSATPAQPSIREMVQGLGLQLEDGLDDQAILRQLAQGYQQAQQAEQYAQYGQAVLPYWSQFQQWLADHQKAQQQPKQQQADQPWYSRWWNPPEYNPAWERFIARDPATGELKAIPGADPSLLPKYLAYQQYQRQQTEKLVNNPFAFFEEPIKHLAQQVAEEVARQHLGGYADTTFANEYVARNSKWLHQYDAQGNVVIDQLSHRPALSAEGRAFAKFVLEAEGLGIRDVRQQQQYAERMLERDLAIQAISKQKAGSNGQQQKQDFLQRASGANHRPGHSGSIPSGADDGASQNPKLPLAERYRQALKEAGITDADLQPAA